ncbi:pyruvate, phosphate dikinase [Alphaproteobacteria bacterium]|nr:pyruvate, phosphate dikinase [Alphaproteobacteria bacterium]MDB2431175.1 pyruvate, phosphate dikinase [Alphaproteobacteria bacterium]
MTDSKFVYAFADGFAEGSAQMTDLLGGKGANLAEMCRMGLRVPPGFTLTSDVCTFYNANEGAFPDGLKAEVEGAMARLSDDMGLYLGDEDKPLLVSVRSGARASMPGMMDTVLNLGLNDVTVAALAAKTGDPRFAWDSYRRFQQMYGDVVMGISHDFFEDIIDDYKFENALSLDADLEADDWQEISKKFAEMIEREAGKPFPQDPQEQLWGAIGAVCNSWNNQRATTYRCLHDIPGEWGTAVTIQSMVFGNLGDKSATGVAFTRNPSTGEDALYGEYLMNAQGEDVVAGIRTPLYLTKAAREAAQMDDLSLEEELPDVHGELVEIFKRLESHFKDMQDVEFTVQNGRVFILQARAGKRTVEAAIKIAVDMVAEGMIDETEALLRIEPASLEHLLHPTLDPRARMKVLTKGLPASPGAASGAIAFSSERAEALAAQGKDVVLVRMETSPEDIQGMYAARAILTSRGGMTSHAAVVARGLGRPCVSGAGQLHIDYDRQTAQVEKQELKEGDVITVDGTSGRIMLGAVPTLEAELTGDFGSLMAWADTRRTMGIRTNAETARDAARALRFGAEGIGLCRTEHMFFDPERIALVREMILAANAAAREKALAQLMPMQRDDFASLFDTMGARPVTIRLLDPPLHEFLPHADDDISALADALGQTQEQLRGRIGELVESNPMLGHRGSRLGITAPEIYTMQLRAIFAAMKANKGKTPVEIMFPLIVDAAELRILKALVPPLAAEYGIADAAYQLGTMIEVPRAAVVADALAEEAVFFSFGTNDLTQTALGVSRDDAARFLPAYVSQGIMEKDPFASFDVAGVGPIVQMAADKGRAVRPDLKLGICGEHGGDPASIVAFYQMGFDYVSCSPFRVPIARLAAAQAAIKDGK